MSDSPPLPHGGDAFVAACLDAPDDAEVRLVFADWLDDRGDLRSKYLRALVVAWELAGTVPPPIVEPVGSERTARDRALAGLRQGKSTSTGWGIARRLWRVWACCSLRYCPRREEPVWAVLDRHARAAVATAELYACGLVAVHDLDSARKTTRRGRKVALSPSTDTVIVPANAAECAAFVCVPGLMVYQFSWAWTDFRWCADLAAILPAVVPEFDDS